MAVYLELLAKGAAKGTTISGLEPDYYKVLLQKDCGETEYISLAARLAYSESYAHEKATLGSMTQDASAFSPEDLPSNLLGILIAKNHVGRFASRPTVKQWRVAMDTELKEKLNECVPLTKKQAIAVWDKYVKNIWATPSTSYTGKLHKRYYEYTPLKIECDECEGVDQDPPAWFPKKKTTNGPQ
jgi:hypothetical protein